MSNLIGRWKLIESKYSDILDYHEYLTALGIFNNVNLIDLKLYF